MELLILLLLAPVTFAYGKSNDPNDEPFLPIYPVYPYSPKLIKRGTDRDTSTQLTPELYTTNPDAKDTYSTNIGTTYQRDPYYATYNPYPKTTSSATYSPYYGSSGYTYSSTPYNVYNPYTTAYSMNPGYSTLPYSSSSYPSYYYQQPYYYPNYYTQPLFPPPPPPPGYDYSNYKDAYTEADSHNKSNDKKTNSEKSKEGDPNQESGGSQFVDGGNYISGHSKDLDGQPSTEKAAGPYNRLDQANELSLKGLPIPLPRTTYRVISVAGQPVGPDYPLPAPYIRAQQLEQLMSQTLAKLLSQNVQQQPQQQQQHQQQQPAQDPQYTGYDVNQNILPVTNNRAQYISSNNYKDSQQYVSIPNVLAKTGLAYVINPNLIGKLTAGQTNSQTAQASTALTTLTKSTNYPLGGYDGTQNSQKDQVTDQQDDYGNYDSQDATVAHDYDKQNQSYQKEQIQPTAYQSQNYVTTRTPQAYSYQYTNYSPTPASARKQAQRYKTNLADINFGAKQTSKG